jgi:hypothetical protein
MEKHRNSLWDKELAYLADALPEYLCYICMKSNTTPDIPEYINIFSTGCASRKTGIPGCLALAISPC